MKPNDRLSDRDKDVLKAIQAWEAANARQCPTYRDLCMDGLPFGTVQDRLVSLERKGMITRKRWVPRSIQLTEQGKAYFQDRP